MYLLKSEQYAAKLDSEDGNIGQRFLGFGKRLQSNIKEKTHIFKETVGTVRTVMEWHSSMTKLSASENAEEGKEVTDEEKKRLESDTLSKSHAALWRGIKLEIESVIREVCDEVLDKDVISREERRRRCIALGVIGEVYCSVPAGRQNVQSSSQ